MVETVRNGIRKPDAKSGFLKKLIGGIAMAAYGTYELMIKTNHHLIRGGELTEFRAVP